MKAHIEKTVLDSIAAKELFFKHNTGKIESAVKMMAEAFENERKLLLFGNGGSAADAQHIAAEFVNRFQMERRPLPAIALTCDTSILTSIGNDYSFDEVFSKQVQALGRKKDIVIAISTSGNSANVVKAAKEAKKMGLLVLGFSGAKGLLKEISDICFCVESDITARIQEVHILLAHILCDLTERMLFND